MTKDSKTNLNDSVSHGERSKSESGSGTGIADLNTNQDNTNVGNSGNIDKFRITQHFETPPRPGGTPKK